MLQTLLCAETSCVYLRYFSALFPFILFDCSETSLIITKYVNKFVRRKIIKKNVNIINTNNVFHLLCTLVSKRSISVNTISSPIKPREELAQYLFYTIESISNCSSYSIENDNTFEFIRTVEEFNNKYSDNDEDDKSYDNNYKQKSENLLPHDSLEYMEKVVNFYGETDRKTDERKCSWSIVQIHFLHVPYQQYVSRFCHYLEAHGTRK